MADAAALTIGGWMTCGKLRVAARLTAPASQVRGAMAARAGLGRIPVPAGKRSRGAEEGREAIGETALRTTDAGGVGSNAPVGSAVPFAAGAVTSCVGALATHIPEAKPVFPEGGCPGLPVSGACAVDG